MTAAPKEQPKTSEAMANEPTWYDALLPYGVRMDARRQYRGYGLPKVSTKPIIRLGQDRLADLLGAPDEAVAAIAANMRDVWRETVVVVITEFGRTAQ